MKKWISVNEEQPKDEKLKVVRYADFYGGENRGYLGIALSRYRKQYGSNKLGWDIDGGTQTTRVTHWADIPSEDTAK